MIIFWVIVYGDPQFNATAAGLLQSLRKKASAIDACNLDELRSLLIETGQLEQAMEDSPLRVSAAGVQRITDCAAAAFCFAYLNDGKDGTLLIQQLRQAACDASALVDEEVMVKIPEGFEFYALYPEQYCLAALAWHSDQKIAGGEVLVIGIRSIGTTLSAVVAATLAHVGWKPLRLTVRPEGPPFAHVTTLPEGLTGYARRAIVVDEGPGLSGSSMASVAEALGKCGFAPGDIAFFPGHGNEPGPEATDAARAWWKRVRRYVTPFEQLRWPENSCDTVAADVSDKFQVSNTKSEITKSACRRTTALASVLDSEPSRLAAWAILQNLSLPSHGAAAASQDGSRSNIAANPVDYSRAIACKRLSPGMPPGDFLRQKSAELLRVDRAEVVIEDLSCGRWREKVFSDLSEWPWAAIPFERMKFRCVARNGAAIFWKFAGLQSAAKCIAEPEWTPQPLGWFKGFAAFPWISGKPLYIEDGNDPGVVRHIAEYSVAVAKPKLSQAELLASSERIRKMLYWNLKEAMGDELADCANQFAERIQLPAHCPAYADGRLAPHEWIRTPEGVIWKLDAMGHDADHTMVGKQPVYWDIAGAMVEWRMDLREAFLSTFEKCEIILSPRVLDFYRIAYAAFRMGQAWLCAQSCAVDAEEYGRTMGAFTSYREELIKRLNG